jgi:hypothetical protein
MRTVPLYGKKAAGRVALVDGEDYDLVMQYRWNVWQPAAEPGQRQEGPYAITNIRVNDGQRHRQRSVRMHTLITGWRLVDHQDHNGLNNQRSNLRLATSGENARNARTRVGSKTSQYKGVSRHKSRGWVAYIVMEGRRRHLGYFGSEVEAAYAYDAAARELHGKFACPNFAEPTTQAMLDQWQAEREQRSAAAGRARVDVKVQWWEQREPERRTCADCGARFQSRTTKLVIRCKACRRKIDQQRQRESRAEKRKRQEGSRLNKAV